MFPGPTGILANLDGLRDVIERHRRKATQFTLRDGSFNGKGKRKDFYWPEVLSAIYEGRGE